MQPCLKNMIFAKKLLNGDIDEVWLWAGNGDGVKHGHLLEWTTTGPGWNKQFIDAPDCGKVISTVTFNFTRDQNLHAYGHRLEGLLGHHVPCDLSTETWPWNGAGHSDFASCGSLLSNRYGFVARPSSDNDFVAGCGDTHFPPNVRSGGDYQYGNTSTENTICQDWSQDGSSEVVEVNCQDWGCTERGYLIWWMQNFPGYQNNSRNREGNMHPNWWEFLFGGKYSNPVATPTHTPQPTNTSIPTDTPAPNPVGTSIPTPSSDEYVYLPLTLKDNLVNSGQFNNQALHHHAATTITHSEFSFDTAVYTPKHPGSPTQARCICHSFIRLC